MNSSSLPLWAPILTSKCYEHLQLRDSWAVLHYTPELQHAIPEESDDQKCSSMDHRQVGRPVCVFFLWQTSEAKGNYTAVDPKPVDT